MSQFRSFWNLLRDCERKLANLPDDLRLIGLCSNAGLRPKTMRNWQKWFMSKLHITSIWPMIQKVKRWIRNTIVGPVLEVAVNDHQGRDGSESRIKSLLGDTSHPWIMIVNGLNNCVPEMSEETHENRNVDIGDSACRPAVKARPKQTSMPMPSFQRVTIRFRMRKWIDVEPGEYDQSFSEVSKKMIRLLRHDPPVPREEDGAVEFKILAPIFASKFASSRTWLSYLQRGSDRKRKIQILPGSLLC